MSGAIDIRPDYATYPRLSVSEARQAATHLMKMRGEGPAVDDATLMSLQRFYNREARLLDEERYAEWYELLADDLFYWMPLRENRFRRDKRGEIAPDNMALFDESKADIAIRIGRLSSNQVWTEDPPTRHVYLVGNVEGFQTSNSREIEAHSTFTQYRNRSEHDEATLIGRRRDLLRRVDGGYQLVRRLIWLPQAVLLTKNLTVFF